MTEQSRPRLLVLGGLGQVGWELTRALSPLGEVTTLDRRTLDLGDPEKIERTVRALAPLVVVNAAAYTAVDRAEAEEADADRINSGAPAALAGVTAGLGSLLVHYSTDYVFDGTGSHPYRESDAPAPHTAYGRTKLRGDKAVLAGKGDAYVFRVGWVYGMRGKNFLRTIQRLLGERDELRVVADQAGAPTWSRAIAEATAQAVGQWLVAKRAGAAAPARGVYNMAAPDHTTWHGFASAIADATGVAAGRARPVIKPITTAEYPTPARRPAWSVLDPALMRRTFGLQLPPWREQLAQCMDSGDPGK